MLLPATTKVAGLWDYILDDTVETMSVTANSSHYAKGRMPLELITGKTPDISEYLDFQMYEWVMFCTNAGLGPSEIGRWLGISHCIGPLMTYWVLPKSRIPISTDSVQRLTTLEQKLTSTGQ